MNVISPKYIYIRRIDSVLTFKAKVVAFNIENCSIEGTFLRPGERLMKHSGASALHFAEVFRFERFGSDPHQYRDREGHLWIVDDIR